MSSYKTRLGIRHLRFGTRLERGMVAIAKISKTIQLNMDILTQGPILPINIILRVILRHPCLERSNWLIKIVQPIRIELTSGHSVHLCFVFVYRIGSRFESLPLDLPLHFASQGRKSWPFPLSLNIKL